MSLTATFSVSRTLRPLTDARVVVPLRKWADEQMVRGARFYIEEMPRDTGMGANLAQPGAGTTRVEVGSNGIPTKIIIGTAANRGGVSYVRALDKDLRRGPGSAPPVKAIERWLARKAIGGTGKGRRSMAFAIAKNIAKKGQTRSFTYVGTANKGSATKGWRARAVERVNAGLPAARTRLLKDIVEALRG